MNDPKKYIVDLSKIKATPPEEQKNASGFVKFNPQENANFDRAWCDLIIDHYENGGSLDTFGSFVNVPQEIIMKYSEEKEIFQKAIIQAQQAQRRELQYALMSSIKSGKAGNKIIEDLYNKHKGSQFVDQDKPKDGNIRIIEAGYIPEDGIITIDDIKKIKDNIE